MQHNYGDKVYFDKETNRLYTTKLEDLGYRVRATKEFIDLSYSVQKKKIKKKKKK